MALCLAISLIVCRDFNPYDQLVRYKWWYRKGYMSSTGQCFDIGSSTRQSLEEFEYRQYAFAQKFQLPIEDIDYLNHKKLLAHFDVYCGRKDAAGNGGLMRLAPIPLFFWRNPQKAVEYSGRSTMTTHGDRKAYDACRYYGALIVAAIHGESKANLLHRDFYQNHIHWFGKIPLHDDVKHIADGSYKQPRGYEDGIRGKGFVLESLKAALWAFWSDDNSFERGVLAAVNLGDDTDTTAAIYGQLAGVYYGYSQLPERWIKRIYARQLIKCLSRWMVYEGERWFERGTLNSKTPFPVSKL
jgi:ADP-ribosylglycohydrolase